MKRVVYVLGAGFSAPLGVPTMSTFWNVAQEMVNDRGLVKYQEVLDEILDTMKVDAYYKIGGALRIEEALSTIEMKHGLGKRSRHIENAKEFICQIIERNTPALEKRVGEERRAVKADNVWHNDLFRGENMVERYGHFVCSLHGLRVIRDTSDRNGDEGWTPLFVAGDKKVDVRYDVVTMNYDMVLEKICANVKSVSEGTEIQFLESPDDSNAPVLAKLHGCVSDR